MSAPVVQNISILPINGTQFSPGSKVVWELPSDLGMIKASRDECYLALTVRNNSTTPLRWMLASSGSALIQEVTVYSMATGQQLEYLGNYNQMMWILDQYGKVTHGIEQTSEGMVVEDYSLDWIGGTTIRRRVTSQSNSDYVPNSVFSPILNDGTPATTSAGTFPSWQICVPLRLGIFGSFSDEQLTPLLALGGLRIEMILARTQPTLVPICPTIDGTVVDSITTTTAITGGYSATQGDTTSLLIVEDTDVESSGLVVGQNMTFQTTGGTVVTTLESIGTSANPAGSIQVEITDAVDCAGTSCHFSTTPDQWAAAVNYNIEDVEMRVLQVAPGREIASKMGDNLEYPFRSYDLFFDSIPAAERRHQVEIHSVSSRAKAIMCLLYDSSLELDENAPAYYLGTDPDTLNLNSAQFFINNRLYPLQPYDPRITKDRPQTLHEVNKAFSSIEQPVVSFGPGDTAHLNTYSNTFLLCRELARGKDFVYDLSEAEPSLRLGFSATRGNITRVNSFVWSDRVVRIDSSGINLIL